MCQSQEVVRTQNMLVSMIDVYALEDTHANIHGMCEYNHKSKTETTTKETKENGTTDTTKRERQNPEKSNNRTKKTQRRRAKRHKTDQNR